MNTDDKLERLQQRIADDLSTLRSMMPEGEIAFRGYLQLIAEGKLEEAREMLSILNRINDNIQRLETLKQGSTDAAFQHDERAYQSLAQAAALLVAAQKGREARSGSKEIL